MRRLISNYKRRSHTYYSSRRKQSDRGEEERIIPKYDISIAENGMFSRHAQGILCAISDGYGDGQGGGGGWKDKGVGSELGKGVQTWKAKGCLQYNALFDIHCFSIRLSIKPPTSHLTSPRLTSKTVHLVQGPDWVLIRGTRAGLGGWKCKYYYYYKLKRKDGLHSAGGRVVWVE